MDFLEAAKHYIYIVESRGLTAASHRYDVPVSALSKQLNWLEKELNKSLIQRTTRRFEVTQAGQLFYEEAKKLVQAKKNAVQAVQYMDPEPSGKIRFALPNSLYRTPMLNVLTDFLIQYPKIKIATINENSPYLIMDDEADLVFSGYELDEPNLICVPIKRFCIKTYASKAYLEKHGRPKRLEDLKDHNCLVGKHLRPFGVWRFGDNVTVNVKGNFVSNSNSILIRMAVNGLGLLHASQMTVHSELDMGLLEEVQLEDAKPLGLQAYLYHRWVEQNSIISLLVEAVKTQFDKLVIK